VHANTLQVLKEIESKATFSAQQLQIVRGQISLKQREKRMLELSQEELASISKETPVYDGVGKMYGGYSAYGGYNAKLLARFVLTSPDDVKDRQSKETTDVDKEMENLNKKLHYLEMTYKNAQQHLEQIFSRTS
jgi:chaperonin cofactor prefoldin